MGQHPPVWKLLSNAPVSVLIENDMLFSICTVSVIATELWIKAVGCRARFPTVPYGLQPCRGFRAFIEKQGNISETVQLFENP